MSDVVGFRYQGLDGNGNKVNGLLHAQSERDVLRQLAEKGVTAYEVEPERQPGRPLLASRTASTRELQLILQEFITLLQSGVTLLLALSSLAKSSHHPQLTTAFSSMEKAVSRGDSFSNALRASKLPLPEYFHQLAQAGEATGRLAESLSGGLQQYEYDLKVQSEITSALIYPLVLVGSGFGAVMIIFLWVVPRFGGLLKQHSEAMPAMSRWVISTGVWMNEHLAIVGMVALGIVILVRLLLATPRLRLAVLESLAHVPLVGPWLVEAEVGRWASTMSVLLQGRVELTRALSLAWQAMRFNFLRVRMQDVGKSVKGGLSLSEALRTHRALNPTGYDLVAVGEASGQLPKLLDALARLYETTGRDRMKRVLQLIEPISIIVIGAVIGTIVTSIILAITSINDVRM